MSATLPATFCRGCGCDEEHACPGGCSWIQPGLCSTCAEELDRWTLVQVLFGTEAAMAALKFFKAQLGAECIAGRGPAPWHVIEGELRAIELQLRKHAEQLVLWGGHVAAELAKDMREREHRKVKVSS